MSKTYHTTLTFSILLLILMNRVMKTYLYITSNISVTNFFKLSSKVSIILFLALKIGSGYSTTLIGGSNWRSEAETEAFMEFSAQLNRIYIYIYIYIYSCNCWGFEGLTRSDFDVFERRRASPGLSDHGGEPAGPVGSDRKSGVARVRVRRENRLKASRTSHFRGDSPGTVLVSVPPK